MFKIGEKVKLISDSYYDVDDPDSVPKGSILTVVKICPTQGQWIDNTTVEEFGINEFMKVEHHFELAEEETVKNRFVVGDKVISIIDTPNIPEGFIGHIFSTEKGLDWDYMVQGIKDQVVEYFNEEELELLSAGKVGIPNGNDRDDITPQNIEGVSKSALDKQIGGGHYKEKGIQPIEYIFANNLGFCEANIVKYATRWKDKNGIQDLEKIIHYTELLIELTKKEELKDKEGK